MEPGLPWPVYRDSTRAGDYASTVASTDIALLKDFFGTLHPAASRWATTRLGNPAGPKYPSPIPRISYYPVEKLHDPELLGYLEDAARYGAPRPESQAIRAHVPAVLRSFSLNWQRTFRSGVVEHSLKELCRVYVSKTIDCHY
jgi:hypothetical protein